jgi:hypothetical protein
LSKTTTQDSLDAENDQHLIAKSVGSNSLPSNLPNGWVPMTLGRDDRNGVKPKEVTCKLMGSHVEYRKVDSGGQLNNNTTGGFRRKLGTSPARKRYMHLHTGMILSSPNRISQLEDAMSEIKKLKRK